MGAEPDVTPNESERGGVAAQPALAEIASCAAPEKASTLIVVAGLVRLSELLLLTGVGFGAHRMQVAPQWGLAVQYLIAIPAMAFLAVATLQTFHLYNLTALRAPVHYGLKIVEAWSTVFIAALVAIFFSGIDDSFSRVWIAGWYVGGLVALFAERFIVASAIRALIRRGRLDRRTVIVGGGPLAEPVLSALARNEGDLRILGVFDDRSDIRSPDVVAGFPKLGTVDDLIEFTRHARIDLIVFLLPITAEDRLLQMLRKLWVLPVDIRVAAHAGGLRFRPRSYSYLGGVPVIDIFDKPIADWDVFIKAAFDKIIGTLCLIILSPVMLAVALAIKLDSPGPVLFKQKRYGFNNEEIEIYKFRSLYANQQDQAASRLVTRVGRLIRKTSLDELPQLFNVVFKGNLSMVGPRPRVVHARAADRLYDEVVDGYFARRRVKPGITGWAQINGWRGETDTPEQLQARVEHDLAYIENWSLMRDIYILAMTPFALLKSENAY